MEENDLQELVETSPVTLDDLVEEKPLAPVAFPDKSVKNRAAITSLLSDNPNALVENYQAMVAESARGDDTIRSGIMTSAIQAEKPKDMSAVISILGDQTASFQQKELAIAAINSNWAKDSSVIAGTNGYLQPSKGENQEQADVRVTGAEQFRSIIEYNREVQKLKNKHTLESDQSTVQSVIDLVEMVVPFYTNVNGATTLKKLAEELKVNVSTGKATALPGSLTAQLVDAFKSIPDSEKLPIARKVYEIVESNSGLILGRDNNFEELIQLKQVIDGDYTTFDKVLDNVSGVLDAIGLGSMLRGSKNAIRSAASSYKARRPAQKGAKATGTSVLYGDWWSGNVYEGEVVSRSFTDTTSPVSPLNLLKDANPEKSRILISTIVNSNDDEVAQALAGTTRGEAVVSQVFPQPQVASGTVATKVIDPLREVTVGERGQEVLEEASKRGAIEYSEEELKRAETHIYNDFKDVDGITLHDNLVTVGMHNGKAQVDAVYGSSEGGFLQAEDALTQVKFALKEYGIKDDELSLLKKEAGEYVPVALEDVAGLEGDYVVKLSFDKPVSPGDIIKMDELDVKRNFLDRFPVLRSRNAGTAANHLFDASSMLHPRITGAAVTDVDRAVILDKKILSIYDDFATKMNSFDDVRKNKVYEHLKEANAHGLELSDNQLLANGFNKTEIEAIKDWREGWDTIYLLENSDLVRTLDIQGFQILEDAQGTRLIGKPIPKNQNIGRVLDISTGNVVSLSKQEMDDLYLQGGSYVSLRRPIYVNGTDIEHIVVKNTPTEYMRGVRSTDQVLNYRKGYYQVQYKAPHFIEEILKDTHGKEIGRKVVGVAGTEAEAKQFISKRASTSGMSVDDFNVRADVKENRVDTDAYWDLQTASGRIAQRYRGKQLEDASGLATAYDGKYMLDPLEAATRASRSIAGRVATREAIEVSKQRALQQYAEYFPLNPKTQRREWVEDSNSLVGTKGLSRDTKLADARTTVEYLNYLTRGYENGLDTGFKQVMNAFASIAAHMDIAKGEEVFNHLGTKNPAAFLKSGVFLSYLALNPLRQLIMQSHQAVRLMSLAPRYMSGLAKDNIATDVFAYTGNILGIIKNPSKRQREIVEFIEESGMLDAVDRSNLIRGAIAEMSGSSNVAIKALGKVVDASRTAGFDTGEQANLLAHLLVLRQNALEAGKDVNDLRVRQEIYSEARAISYDMNFAGDMPYNQNSLSLGLQFFQVPHKAFSMYTNRRISGVNKLKLAAGDMLLWGVPGIAILSSIIGEDALPEDPQMREGVLFGLESVLLNTAIMKLLGTDAKLDFSGFAPYNIEGFANLAHAITSGGFAEFLQNTPAYTLYVKDGGRMREAMSRMLRYTGMLDEQEGHEPETILSVLSGIAEMSSGWNNAMKAKIIYETGKLQNKKGGVLNDDAHWVLAAAKVFGINSQEELLKYQAMTSILKNDKAKKEEWDKWYQDYIKVLSRDQKLNNQDPDYVVKVLGAAKMYFNGPDKFAALSYINSKLGKDMLTNDQKIIKMMLQDAGLMDAASLTAIKSLTTLTPDNPDLQKAEKLMNDVREVIKRDTEEGK